MSLLLPPRGLAFAVLILHSLLSASEPPGRADAELILSDVVPFQLGDAVPGVLEKTGASSRVLLSNDQGKALAAIGTVTDGRLLAFSHGSFLKAGFLNREPGAYQLIANGISWAGKARTPLVGLAPEVGDLEPVLVKMGMRVKVLEPGKLNGQVDVFCLQGQQEMTPEEIGAIQRFLHKGGGVIVAATPWPFKDRFPQFSSFPANQIAGLADIEFQPEGYASVKGPVKTSLPDPEAAVTSTKALASRSWKSEAELDALLAQLESGKLLTDNELVTFSQALAELDDAIGPVIPTLKSPITPAKDKLAAMVVQLRSALNQLLPPEHVPALPAASEYPGAVDPEAERVTQAFTIDATYKGWLTGRGAGAWNAKELRPTGLYAAPGEVITVTVEDHLVDAGYAVVIGAYNGGLENRDKWQRYPNLRRSFSIRDQVTLAANGLGGLINIQVPQNASLGKVKVQIEGAVRAPLYVHGVTRIQDWNAKLRQDPAPWAELVSDRIIIAIPSSFIRDLKNPDEVMTVWNSFIDKSAELVMVDRDNYRAERIVFERQPAAGYMHSGYPVAAPQDKSATLAVDAKALREEGNWGFFHEYGHNHQHNLWALPGTGETTCNLWSVYLFEELVGIDRDETHRAISPLNRRQRIKTYFGNGRNFEEEWNVWTALETYLQLQEAFGWEPFRKVFDEYNRLPESEWPKTQQDRNDQWVIRFSKAVGKNLVPFFEAWNLPMSDSVQEELQSLPAWEDHPVAGEVK